MTVRVFYDNGHDFGEFEYISNYKRINAKGIKEEIEHTMYMKYGKKYKITSFYRVD